MTTNAMRDGEHYVLNGRKCWITGAGVSKRYLVFARFDGKPRRRRHRRAARRGRRRPGLTVPRIPMMMGLRGMPEGEVSMVNCRVPGEEPRSPSPATASRSSCAATTCSASGRRRSRSASRRAHSISRRVRTERKQFGKPIGDFQGLQWMLADMHMQIECSRLLVYRAAMGGVNGFPDKIEAAAAKIHAAEMAIQVTNQALQIFGAAGYSCDLPIERMVRDARMFTIGGGTAQVQRNLIGARSSSARRAAGASSPRPTKL